jgi:dipeptidyl aminopeptidase/acylaminoacyl peptidase
MRIAGGRDFYAAPRISPDGRSLAFLCWDHPRMPWDGTDLFLATFAGDGDVASLRHIAGGETESIQQPSFAPDGMLYFVSDRTEWWNLYRFTGQVEPLLSRNAEFGVPPWVFGISTYAFASADRIVCAYNELGTWKLGVLNTKSGVWRATNMPYTDIAYVRAQGDRALFVAASSTEPPAIVRLDLDSSHAQVVRRSVTNSFGVDTVSAAHAIDYAVPDGERVHAFLYRPQSALATAPSSERPPLLVMSHGGPTSATSSALNLKIQYWTSRGFAVLDVNYRGSTGYGRSYRRRLDGGWGVIDVEDCVQGALHMVGLGEVDSSRLAIRGGSAGGYTTLCALTFHDVFRAGASHYGISDLELLARDTHKFESRYLERLVGPYPQARARYRERSPIHHAERLNCPVIFFQGAEDRVVPPNQTERLVQALKARSIPVAYLLFPGEQHGFRRAENVRRALESELYFYARVFGFTTDVSNRVVDPFL